MNIPGQNKSTVPTFCHRFTDIFIICSIILSLWHTVLDSRWHRNSWRNSKSPLQTSTLGTAQSSQFLCPAIYISPIMSCMVVSAANIHERISEGKGKAVPLEALSSPEGSRKLRFPDFMTTAQEVRQPYAQAVFTPRKCSWYSFLLEAESTPGP